MINYLPAYLVIGMASLAWCLCLYPARFNGWVHAIIASTFFVLFWPAFIIHGFMLLWKRGTRR